MIECSINEKVRGCLKAKLFVGSKCFSFFSVCVLWWLWSTFAVLCVQDYLSIWCYDCISFLSAPVLHSCHHPISKCCAAEEIKLQDTPRSHPLQARRDSWWAFQGSTMEKVSECHSVFSSSSSPGHFLSGMWPFKSQTPPWYKGQWPGLERVFGTVFVANTSSVST